MSEYAGLISILLFSLIGVVFIAGDKFHKMVQGGKMVIETGKKEINSSGNINLSSESKKLKSDFWDKISEDR